MNDVRFSPDSGHANENFSEESTGPSRLGLRLNALAHPREIRTPANLRSKLSLSPFTFLNYTKTTKYEALEKNAVSGPRMPQIGNLSTAVVLEKPPFVGRFSTCSFAEKWGVSGGGRGTGIEPSPRNLE
jgi:hypothetical protein